MIPHQSHPHDKYWISEQIKRFPYRFRPHLARRYSEQFAGQGRAVANLSMQTLGDRVDDSGVRVSLISDDGAIVAKAARAARACSAAWDLPGDARFMTLINTALIHTTMDYLPEPGGYAPGGAGGADARARNHAAVAARLSSEKWWRRALRKQQGRAIESLGRNISLVSQRDGIYCTDETAMRRGQQKSRNRGILEKTIAVNQDDQEYTLQALSDLSVANPEIRRGELMTRIRGFEDYAEKRGDVGEFWTITLPSKYHATLSRSGEVNPKYDNLSPRDGQKKLGEDWARVRAQFHKAGIKVYGFRVVEPHQDGTPHWHMLLFMPESQRSEARRIYYEYAIKENRNEIFGREQVRFKAIAMARGGAAGYIAKYISKNIDGYKLDSGRTIDENGAGMETGVDAKTSAERIEAWAACWGIRQFQQIGGHSVTIWRELRRLDVLEVDARIRPHVVAASVGADWCAYLEAMDADKLSLSMAWNDKPGQYGEPVGNQIIGVASEPGKLEWPKVGNLGRILGGRLYVTRVHTWEIKPGARSAPAWSSVNNCTGDLCRVEIDYTGPPVVVWSQNFCWAENRPGGLN
jgi:hypothetical protein